MLADHVAEGPVDVGAEADHVVHGGRLRRKLGATGKPGVVHGQPHQVELVFTVEDREIRFIAKEMGSAPEEAVADVVKCSGPDARALLADQGLEPLHHFPGGAPGEGDQHDRPGRNTGCDQVGDTVGDHPRLAGARAGQDQVIAVGGRCRRALRFIQLTREVVAQSIV